MELVDFLRARLDEDEAAARMAAEELGSDWYYRDGSVQSHSHYGSVASGSQDFLEPERGDHIARHDPARVLAEVGAKRGDLHQYEEVREQVRNPVSAENRRAARIEQGALADVLRRHARVYRDHSDFDLAWLEG